MAWAIKAQLTGLEAVKRKLETIKRGTANRIVRKGITKATQAIVKAVKAATPQLTGLAAKSVGQRVKTYRGGSAIVGIVGPRTGFKRQVTLAITPEGVRGALTGTGAERKLLKHMGKTIGPFRAGQVLTVNKVYNPVKYFHFIESGRATVRPTKKRALSSGLQFFRRRAAAVGGKHPLERTWAAQQAQASETVRQVCEDGIAQLARAA